MVGMFAMGDEYTGNITDRKTMGIYPCPDSIPSLGWPVSTMASSFPLQGRPTYICPDQTFGINSIDIINLFETGHLFSPFSKNNQEYVEWKS